MSISIFCLHWLILECPKSNIYFTKNVQGGFQVQILNILGLQKGFSKVSHLGLPLLLPKSKLEAFSRIQKKVKDRISGWKAKLLSQAGRTQLLKSVAVTILSYHMSTYALPLTLCHNQNKIMKKIWWGFSLTFPWLDSQKLGVLFLHRRVQVAGASSNA